MTNDRNKHSGGARRGNNHGTRHAAYKRLNKLYTEVFSAKERDLADWFEEIMIEEFIRRNGYEPIGTFKNRMFLMACNLVTETRVDNWYVERPEELETGAHVPGIDREKHVTEDGKTYYRYKQSPAVGVKKMLMNYNNKWLKSFNMFPEGEQAKAMKGLAQAVTDDQTVKDVNERK